MINFFQAHLLNFEFVKFSPQTKIFLKPVENAITTDNRVLKLLNKESPPPLSRLYLAVSEDITKVTESCSN